MLPPHAPRRAAAAALRAAGGVSSLVLYSPWTSEGTTGSGDGSALFHSGESQIRTYAQGNWDLDYAVLFHRRLVLVYTFHHFSRREWLRFLLQMRTFSLGCTK